MFLFYPITFTFTVQKKNKTKAHGVKYITYLLPCAFTFPLNCKQTAKKNSNYIFIVYSFIILSIFFNCLKGMRKTQITSSRVTKYAKIKKSCRKTACFPSSFSLIFTNSRHENATMPPSWKLLGGLMLTKYFN